MILGQSNRALELLLGEVKTTSEVEIAVHYEDTFKEQNNTPVEQLTKSNGVTAVVITSAPGDNVQRRINEIIIYNADTVSHTVFVRINEAAGTNISRVLGQLLVPGQSISYSDDIGWNLGNIAGLYAPITDAHLLGVPTAPTAARGTNTTQLATTAFVQNPYGIFQAHLAAAQTLTSATWAKIAFDTVDVDTEAAWDATNKRYVIPKAGKWAVDFNVTYFATSLSTTVNHLFEMYKNGTVGVGTLIGEFLTASHAATLEYSFGIAPFIYTFALGDTVELDANITGTTPKIDGAGATNLLTKFGLRWVSP